VNQLAFGLGALAAAIPAAAIGYWWLRRLRSDSLRARSDAAYQAAFEQWPTGALVLNTATLQIVAANPAVLRSLGYSLEEVRTLRFGELFPSRCTSAARTDHSATSRQTVIG
jgi:PAS domain-containing protein